MALSTEKKREIFEKFGKGVTDTGSPESQIALLTARINELAEHLKRNHKDHTAKRSLLRMVGRRRKLLKYVRKNDIQRYRDILKALNLRK